MTYSFGDDVGSSPNRKQKGWIEIVKDFKFIQWNRSIRKST